MNGRWPGRVMLVMAGVLGTAGCGGSGPRQSEILWDTWGVPHVYGVREEDVARGFGWAQARSHGDALLRLYGLARGRGAEYWGERWLSSDRVLWTLGVPQAGAAALNGQTAEFRRYLEAFAEGVNAYAAAYPGRIADSLEVVLPVTAEDLLRHALRGLLTFASVTGSTPPPLGFDALPSRALAGSNTWAIAPARSASGHALLLQNPHLPWNLDLMRFYEAHLVGPDGWAYGTTLLGYPVLAIGFNDVLGWSHTVNTIDVLDVYVVRPAGTGYVWNGATRPFETRTHVLGVREADGGVREDTVVARSTVHGPVVQLADGRLAAVRTPALDRLGGLAQWREMGRARSREAFETALRRLQVPMFTVVYADRDGHILYLFNGALPARPRGDFDTWLRPVAGDTAATLWSDIVDYGDLPRLLDPPAGFVQNSNSPPWLATYPSPLDPADFPAWLAPTGLLWREQRGLQMLTGDSSITFEELRAMRYSNRMLLADRILDDLLPAARAAGGRTAEAAEVLAAWDRTTDADSRGGVLFQQWVEQLLSGAGGDEPFATPWRPDDPLNTPDGLADPPAAVAALRRAAEVTLERHGALDIAWGAVNRLGAYPGNGGPGDPFGLFHVIAYAPTGDGQAQALAGDTWVGLIEFTPDGPRAEVLLSYGNATQDGAPGNRDQLRLLAEKTMRVPWLARTEVEANLAATDSVPGGTDTPTR